MKKLSDVVTVSPRFKRSIRIDVDYMDENALNGYVCHRTSRKSLETMAKEFHETNQRAFTLTGPYGSGKSSLALLLCQILGGNLQQRNKGLELLGDISTYFRDVFIKKEPWRVIPLVGRRSDPVSDLRKLLMKDVASDLYDYNDTTGQDVIDVLLKEAETNSESGVVLVMDEMGKYLEYASDGKIDIHFFQDLAEAAVRSKGRILIIGVLHQSFDQYVFSQGKNLQEDWAKVQGRYIDIPVVVSTDEVLVLIGHALHNAEYNHSHEDIFDKVSNCIRRRRPSSNEDLGMCLSDCWPLHPVTASLIGPLSRRRFSQNERSVFGFLNTLEINGFQEFLKTNEIGNSLYEPYRLWDYLRDNMESTILASPDSHRWSQAVDAIQRCEYKGNSLHVSLVKSIAVIELFNGNSGVVPERDILLTCVIGISSDEIDQALQQLQEWSIITFKKHLNSFALFAGSDFDIETAIFEGNKQIDEINLERLSSFADLHSILAKKHYFKTGTLRWFTPVLVSTIDLETYVANYYPTNGESGQFLLVIPNDEHLFPQMLTQNCHRASMRSGCYPIAIGSPPNAQQIRKLGIDLLVLESIRQIHPDMEGDVVARRDVESRISVVSAELEDSIRLGFEQTVWYVNGRMYEVDESQSLSNIASVLADITFPNTPYIYSEIINREKPVKNKSVIRTLMHAMVNNTDKDNLDIKGFPGEMGIYQTVFKSNGLHRKCNGVYGFYEPTEEYGSSFIPMWNAAKTYASKTNGEFPISDIYEIWKKPPFGVRSGLIPLLATAFILSQKSSFAIYVENTFQHEINDFVIDRLRQDSSDISLRYVYSNQNDTVLLESLRNKIKPFVGREVEIDVLDVARALVEFVFSLPEWTQHTLTLSTKARQLCQILQTANNPYRLIFDDLIQLIDNDDVVEFSNEIEHLLKEMKDAYDVMLTTLKNKMLDVLGHSCDSFDDLHYRAKIVKGISGDLHLDSFASRLQEFSGTLSDMESIAGLLIKKPSRMWRDLDPDRATIEVGNLSLSFRQTEVLAKIQGRESSRNAISVIVGDGKQDTTLIGSVDLSYKEQELAENLSIKIQDVIKKTDINKDVILAALADVCLKYINTNKNGSE